MKLKFVCGMLSVVMLTLTGCGGGPDLPDTYPASGVVTLDDKPVEGAIVTFYPEKGRQAIGETNGSGEFTLTTFNTGDGAVEGSFKVAILPPTDLSVDYTATGEDVAPAGLTADGSAEAVPDVDESVIPVKYQSADKSGLTYTVTAGGENKFDIKLSSSK